MLSPNHGINPQNDNQDILYLFEKLAPFKKTKWYKKGEEVISIGEVSNKFVFVENGILRTYYINEDFEEITSGFTFQGDIDIVCYSFFSRKVSKEAIVALTDCKLDVYYYHTVINQLMSDPRISNTIFKLLSKYIETLEFRLFEMRDKNAAERYQFLKERQPESIDNIPDYIIASYLGISKERMSRIKNKK